MAKIPDSTQTSLRQELLAHAAEHPLPSRVRHIDATLNDGEDLKLCRLRYAGSASQ